MEDIKMIVMDLDGTLLTREQRILEYTKDVLMQCQKQGISLVIASGRDINSIQEIGQRLNMPAYLQNAYICLNGLEIYDMQNQLLHQENKLTYEDAVKLAGIAKKYKVDIVFSFKDCLYIIEYGYTGIINDHFMTMVKYKVKDIQDIPQECFDYLKKIIFIEKAEVMGSIIRDIQESTRGQYEVCMVEPEWVEINPNGVSKGKALQVLSNIKNIPLKNILAFGNGENDITMLKTAGIGVAMENSFESVKSIADDVCGHCHEDGIGKYLVKKKQFML